MTKGLKIVFMGTPEFAVATLDKLHNSEHEIVGVITAPDKRAGRGKKLNQSAVKKYVVEENIFLMQPTNLKDEDFITELNGLEADLFIVVAFRMLPKIVWQMPSMGTINLHGSLLPEYRGAAPINWAVINGDKKTGVTSFFINEKIDTGSLLMQEEILISNEDTAGSLHDKMMDIGATLILKTVNEVQNDTIISKEQTWNEKYRPAPKIFKEDCAIDWTQDAITIRNKIRGLSPYPTAFTILTNEDDVAKKTKLFYVEMADSSGLLSGEVSIKGEKTMLIGTATNDLLVLDLQFEGKKRMEIEAFLRGLHQKNGWKALQNG